MILKEITRNFLSLYFKNKNQYRIVVNKYRNFYSLFNVFHNLRIFDFKVIKKILTDPELVDLIFKKKEKKLLKSYEKYKIYNLSNQNIDEIIEAFLNNDPPIISPLLINTIII